MNVLKKLQASSLQSLLKLKLSSLPSRLDWYPSISLSSSSSMSSKLLSFSSKSVVKQYSQNPFLNLSLILLEVQWKYLHLQHLLHLPLHPMLSYHPKTPSHPSYEWWCLLCLFFQSTTRYFHQYLLMRWINDIASIISLWTRIFHVRPHSIGETRFLFICEKLIF